MRPSSPPTEPLNQKPVRKPRTAAAVRMSVGGLIAFSASLVLTSSVLTWLVTNRESPPKREADTSMVFGGSPVDPPEPAVVPEWGELIERDIQMERPDEYTGFELSAANSGSWTFPGATPDQARALMQSCGLPESAIERALSPQMATVEPDRVIVRPDEALLLSIPGPARTRLYAELGKTSEIASMVTPFSFPTKDFTAIIEGSGLSASTLALIKKLSYQHGDRTYLSDMGFILRSVSTEAERLSVARALSRIPAVLVRLRVRADSDIDKIVAYWASVPGVRSKDVRPLLESVQRANGNISLTYLLPPFARERLYTFPLTSKAGEVDADCHWSTMNFFNETPDDRFSDVKYTSAYIAENYYPIAQPSKYGDLVFVLDEKGGATHSAVFIAGDIVFTKNGQSFGQPWLLMHLADVASLYSQGTEPRLLFYRKKDS